MIIFFSSFWKGQRFSFPHIYTFGTVNNSNLFKKCKRVPKINNSNTQNKYDPAMYSVPVFYEDQSMNMI